jgi:dTDP-glucose pyrophosphorylase
MLNIVIPMAGHGSRFAKAGYKIPKPLITVLDKPMVQLVTENLKPKAPHRFIFICQAEHIKYYSLGTLLESVAPGCEIIEVSQVTEGAACTVLLAKRLINNQDPLMIANCDQYVDVDINDYLQRMEKSSADGLIMTMNAHDTKWSYIKLNAHNEIIKVVEKEVVSDEATVGIYNYKHGSDFVRAAEKMIQMNLRVNNEFYVAPAYNEMLAEGKKISFFNIGFLGAGMHGLGTPEDLDVFINRSK